LYRVGVALGVIKGNTTHSGNLSLRDPDDPDRFFITARGSQCAALKPANIVTLRFSEKSKEDERASTEPSTNRNVLGIKGVNSVVHAHFINTTIISFDTKEKQIFLQYLGNDSKGREEFLFLSVDILGALYVGSVPVGSYFQPVGSAEMEERIPKYLVEKKSTIVRTHGFFVRVPSPEEALHLITVLEISAGIAIHLRRRGIDVVEIQRLIHSKERKNFLSPKPQQFKDIDFNGGEVKDEVVIQEFKHWLVYNYNNHLGGFATGSMSQKVSKDGMIFCPLSALPEGFRIPLLKKSIKPEADDSLALKIHKLIYQHTDQNTCMITFSPGAVAEGMVILAEKYENKVLYREPSSVSYTAKQHPVINAIDAEARYCNPRLGLVDMTQLNHLTPDNPILNMLRWYKGCCVVANYGVISTSSTTLEQAAHNAALAERIARFKQEVFINQEILDGPAVKSFEP